MNNFTGNRYDRSLTTTQISALFREDLKKAIKEGKLPKGLKVSVKTEYYSGGSSIHVRVTQYPLGDILTPAYREFLTNPNWARGFDGQRRTDDARALLETLKEMLNAYNRDDSNSCYDHFDRRFYEHVSFDSALER